MQPLISINDFSKAIGTQNFPVKKLNQFLLNFLKLNDINDLYSDNYDENSIKFIDQILKGLKVNVDFLESELKKIPKEGPFITISNHPFGAIDGLILLKLILERRPDYHILANYLLTEVVPIAPHVLPVNPFGKNKKSSFSGMKLAMKKIEEGHPVGIFPAGEVSTFQNLKTISDKEWKHSVVKLIKNSKVPVVPIYFHGNNSLAFHLLGLINSNLRTIKLPSELMNKKNKSIQVRVGCPIINNDEIDMMNITDFSKYLRAKTYALGSSMDVRKFHIPKHQIIKKTFPIDQEVNKMLLLNEINGLNEYLLFNWGDYKVFCTPTSKIPQIIKEIGVLREKTFRAVGEGTGKAIDIDEFDIYYEQLFIWDNKNLELVGGYRIGKGREIYAKYKKKGFYLNTLFKLKKGFEGILQESIELGRSFIVESYQKKAFPLFCLWKGIMTVLVKNPEYRYLIGPVSISNQFSSLSKSLIIDFLKTNYYDFEKSTLIKPRKRYKMNYKYCDYRMFIETSKADFNKIDKIIEDIEPNNIKVPILFRRYLEQNAKIIGFNQDPKFNNALDGLMILDVNNIPVNTIKKLTQDKNEYHEILNRFYGQYMHYLVEVPQL